MARSRSGPGGITGRAITLGALVISLVLLLVYPVTHYVQQNSQIDAANQQIADTKVSIGKLQAQLDQLSDDAYVKAQARARLNYITPGDKVYVVADNGPDSETSKKAEAAKKAKQQQNSSALGDLADSIAKADSGG